MTDAGCYGGPEHKKTTGMESRKNFWLIYKEAVNNAAKYSKAKSITISLAPLHNFIVLIVKDDGVGFDLQQNDSGNVSATCSNVLCN